jgi:hypothetical protein
VQWATIKQNHTVRGVVEPRNQANQCRLASA